MLKILSVLMLLAGCCTMLASIATYRGILRSYLPDKALALNRYTAIQLLMVFFFVGYVATLSYFIFGTHIINIAMTLIAAIFFFGAIFCYSVVSVQSELLDRLEGNASKLQQAFEEVKNANANLEHLNSELVDTMNALKETQSQLVFSEKMSVLGKLMAGIFHEINTPIGVVKASVTNMLPIFDDQLSQIIIELRRLSEDDFQDFLQFLKIAVINNKKFTSTSEIRALKRNAKGILGDAGFDATMLEIIAQDCLLDAETVQLVASKQNPEAFKNVLRLINKILPVFTSLDSIDVSVEKVIKIVSSLKTFSHVSINNEKSLFSITAGIETVLVLYVNQLKYSIEVVTDFEEVPQISGYEDELSQVWSNLIQNAIYAMEGDNDTPREGREQCVLSISVKNTEDNRVAVSISDNGIGMSAEKTSRIFEPFYTTKPIGIGSGLGLSISRQIVEKHGGVIQATSVEGVGSTFTVILPV